ncbi:hypothetical protein AYO47_02425 [Planctomyces sp. SCGC AG-212-M04]|nr:hypothetical protein AYO47_02425 [Planctomyces sp. SCGC AG-212-M04]
MKLFLGFVLAFGLGVVVGTSGSDDSLLRESVSRESTAYDRGYRAAVVKCQAMANQMGYGDWEFNPHTGRCDKFVWTFQREAAENPSEDLAPAVALSNWDEEPAN